VTKLTCDETMDGAAEFALGILPPSQRAAVAAHLLGCQACHREVTALSNVASTLVNVIPGTEPPLGFDRAVLRRVRPRQRTTTIVVGVVAAVAMLLIVAASVFALAPGSRHKAAAFGVVSVFRQDGVRVGTLTASGHPLWVSVAIRGVDWSGSVTCQLVSPRGAAVTLGAFDLVHGGGSWAAYEPAWMVGDGLARLVNRDGQVLATAVLH
jgi:anti-sigma factor RsiW